VAARYGVTRLALFGSTACDTARGDSDLNILIVFDGPAASERYFGVQFYLEDLFGCPIDLVTGKGPVAEAAPIHRKRNGPCLTWHKRAKGPQLPRQAGRNPLQ